MELQFNKTEYQSLKRVLCQVQSQEQTQEVRLAESAPDIGRVLGCWGQVIMRGKEWRSDEIGMSGGVMAWVLYAPEDGSEPRSIETWLPFQMKWDIPQTQRDGSILVMPLLKCVDARSISARKLMLRANLSVLAQAMEPADATLFQPGQVQDDIQLLKKSYPVELPVEAGEMQFQIDEELKVPGSYPQPRKILYYQLYPKITESRVMTDKLLFRGKLQVHMLYTGEDDEIHHWDGETAFSKYTQLDREHGSNAVVRMLPVITGSELDIIEDHLNLKVSMAAQYVVYDRILMDVIEDAYSLNRDVETVMEHSDLTVRLDCPQMELSLKQNTQWNIDQVLDVSWCWDHPSSRQDGDDLEMNFAGQFQVLYMDENHMVQCGTVRAEDTCKIASDAKNHIDAYPFCAAAPLAHASTDGANLSVDMGVQFDVFSQNGVQMVAGLEVGDLKEPDPARPSIILQKSHCSSLWELAKKFGSTVDAIRDANHLQSDPSGDQILLIPVL